MPRMQLLIENNQPLAHVIIQKSGQTAPEFVRKSDSFICLIDTGATVSCITPKVVNALKLQSHKQARLISANNASITNVYIVDIYLPFKNTQPQFFGSVEVAENTYNHAFDCIIGMDIISLGVLVVSGNSFIFSI